MSFDNALAKRVRAELQGRPFTEKKIVGGGLGFVIDSKMIVGVVNDDLMLRLETEANRESALKQADVRALTFKNRATAAYVLIAPAATKTSRALKKWLDLGLSDLASCASSASDSSKRAPKKKAADTAPPKGAVSLLHLQTISKAFLADKKLRSVIDDFVAQKATSKGRKFGTNALKANDKLFALFTRNTVVVKLPKARVAELVESGEGTFFESGSRVMKEWLAVTSESKPLWVRLAKEAHAFATKSK